MSKLVDHHEDTDEDEEVHDRQNGSPSLYQKLLLSSQVASKSTHQEQQEKAEQIEELLDYLDKALDRVKVLYEQFFLGMQKQPPTQVHTEIERKLRDLQQMQIRNTAQRYRFATLQQKFGSYNTYWRRTLRQIENGTYHRNLAKISRQAAMTGEEVPDEILAAMPKRMREQVLRDRELALARKVRRDETAQVAGEISDEGTNPMPVPPSSTKVARNGAHILDDSDGDFDLDAFFAAVTNDDAPRAPPAPPPRASAPARTQPEAVPVDLDDLIDPPISQPAPAPRLTPVPQRAASPRPGQPNIPPPRPPQAPSQVTRPVPVMPGSSTQRVPVPVESLSGPFPRPQTPPPPPPPRTTQPIRPPAPNAPRMGPPPGMTDADVNALYAKYVKAKEAVGEKTGPGAYGKLLQTINAQAPKIMEQYKAKGVDFQVVVKDNQVVIRAKPKP